MRNVWLLLNFNLLYALNVKDKFILENAQR